MAALSVKIRKKVGARAAGRFVLDAEGTFQPGFTVIFGPSGAGKSSLLDCVAGLQRPDEGRIAIGDRVFFDSDSGISLRPADRQIAYVFQSLALFPHMSVEDNVGYGLLGFSATEAAGRVGEALRAFRVEGLRTRKPREISGGEQQRVALARSLVTNPRLLLLDEPLSGLDMGLKTAILSDLREWNAAHEIPILYVTHSHDEVQALGERVIGMEGGNIVQRGDFSEVLGAPKTRPLAEASGYENLLAGKVLQRREAGGVMRVQLAGANIELEVPLAEAQAGSDLIVAIRAGDILVATERPVGLSARNVFRGRLDTMERQGYRVEARLDAGVPIIAHLTPGATRSLQLEIGQELWLVIKTHSCHVISGS